jgi:hypothetical protein
MAKPLEEQSLRGRVFVVGVKKWSLYRGIVSGKINLYYARQTTVNPET